MAPGGDEIGDDCIPDMRDDLQSGADVDLLDALGVQTANPSDIERTLAASLQSGKGAGDECEGGAEGEEPPEEETQKSKLQRRLRALQSEIDVVGAAYDSVRGAEGGVGEGRGPDGEEAEEELGGVEEGSKLQEALAAERLKSLVRKRKQLKGQLADLRGGGGGGSRGQGTEALRRLVVEGEDERKKGEGSGGRGGGETEGAKSKAEVQFVADDDFDAALDAAGVGMVETERDRLIRTGVITPFDRLTGFHKGLQAATGRGSSEGGEGALKKRMILLEGDEVPKKGREPPVRCFKAVRKPLKRQGGGGGEGEEGGERKGTKKAKRQRPQLDQEWRKKRKREEEEEDKEWSGEEEEEEEEEGEEEGDHRNSSPASKVGGRSMKGVKRGRQTAVKAGEVDGKEEEEEEVVLEGGLKVAGKVWGGLFGYQQTGLKWMWELHCQKAGGIIGDEMGLGKTVQVAAFLGALHHSGLYRPTIVVCPATLLVQWKRELHKWHPRFKCHILHDSAHKGVGKKGRGEEEAEWEEEEDEWEEEERSRKGRRGRGEDGEEGGGGRNAQVWKKMVNRVAHSHDGVLLTTYDQLRIRKGLLLDVEWGYAVLDEGHRIRNPDAAVTLVCKQLHTVHRVIMTGAPIQNRLAELWSLFDFVFPGKLGTLPVFTTHFALPISLGGYSNASPLQASTAYKCAVVLRDLILPYLLRRMKADVETFLPKKTEQVLFCSLTEVQRAQYRAFLGSSELEAIFEGDRNALYGIDILRKICNHPDLLEREQAEGKEDYGNVGRSGKLVVVKQVLRLWHAQGHRVLLFTQTQQMLDIMQGVMEAEGHCYRRMDGSTPVAQRMGLIDEFNEGGHVFVFLLTTKVGGLGTNLVGADRVILFDPDWNPSADMQARERAWRIGQTREVTIYRLITRGTIEEKIYHRQIYKQMLTNRILKDPRQKRLFKAKDMRDLFSLAEDKEGQNENTETAKLLAGAGEVCNVRLGGAGGEEGEGEKEAREGKEEGGGEGDASILRNLFRSNGVHVSRPPPPTAPSSLPEVIHSYLTVAVQSAMDHSLVEGLSANEQLRVDHESSRVATRAAEAVNQSRIMRQVGDDVAVPTWTGRSGEAGAPPAVRQRFGNASRSATGGTTNGRLTGGPGGFAAIGGGIGSQGGGARALTSVELLTQMRERRATAHGGEGGDGALALSLHGSLPRTGGGGGVEVGGLEGRLTSFLRVKGGGGQRGVSTAVVLEQFREFVEQKGMGELKKALREVAALVKEEGGGANWVLKTRT